MEHVRCFSGILQSICLRFMVAGFQVCGCHHDPVDVSRGGANPRGRGRAGGGCRDFQVSKGLFWLRGLSCDGLESKALSLASLA